MLRRLVSFGFKYGKPHVEDTIIDVRKSFTRNPYHDPTLRQFNGLDVRVQEDIRLTPNFEALYEHLKKQVLVPGAETVYLGCTGGHHRSVFLAEQLGKELGVPVEHRDLHKLHKL